MSDRVEEAKSKLLRILGALALQAPDRNAFSGEVEACVDDIVAAAVEVAGAATAAALHELREHLTKVFGKGDLHAHALEQRVVALEQRQPGEDRHTLVLMAAMLAAGDTRGGDVHVYVAIARAVLEATEQALGIVPLTEPAGPAIGPAASVYVRHAGGDAWHISTEYWRGEDGGIRAGRFLGSPGSSVETLCGGRIVPTLQRRCDSVDEPEDLCPECNRALVPSAEAVDMTARLLNLDPTFPHPFVRTTSGDWHIAAGTAGEMLRRPSTTTLCRNLFSVSLATAHLPDERVCAECLTRREAIAP